MKIVILDGYTENPGDLSWEGFERIGDLKVYDRSPLDDELEIIERIADADIVYTNKTPISANIINASPNLKFIGLLATGFNVVDIEAARAIDIPVANIPTYGSSAVGQFAIALLLEICHHIGHHDAEVKAGRWENSPDFCFWDFPLIELDGKTMGIIGFGRIGQVTGRIAMALGMRVLAYDSYRNPDLGDEHMRYVDLQELFQESDVICLHCPLTPETESMINKKTIAMMKNGVIIINNSRGQLIVEEDLAEALNSGKVYAAGLDVVSAEPIKGENPLLTAKNCFITPHISWAPKESRQRLMDIAVSNLKAFLDGEARNVVN